ncbi:hypothetical protein QR680_008358 [Steinernema hermaphroditum]|uniref:Uncharacterized protein n=1 Tax=Steinernema hermaphroditum TaxID=289476 RepID=A0AA39IHT2_9BILA|nr:hypothetical protein QR680_008358 [Steinernema hermaphroditum]
MFPESGIPALSKYCLRGALGQTTLSSAIFAYRTLVVQKDNIRDCGDVAKGYGSPTALESTVDRSKNHSKSPFVLWPYGNIKRWLAR